MPQFNTSNNYSGNLKNKKSNMFNLARRAKAVGVGNRPYNLALVVIEGNALTDFQVQYLVARYDTSIRATLTLGGKKTVL